MTKLSRIVAAGAVAALALAGSPAVAADLRADIPFAFQVGGRTMPAGTYLVTTSQSVLGLRSADGGVFVMTGRLESGAWQQPTLVFERTAGAYVLQQAWTGGGTGRALPRGDHKDGERRDAVAQETARVTIPLL